MSNLTGTAVPQPAPYRPGIRLRSLLTGSLLFPGLLAILAVAAVTAAAVGAAGIPLDRLPAALGLTDHANSAALTRDSLVLWSVRLPRIAIAIVIGALLASSGAIMQGLFRNPLADPALVGVSSGGALAAASVIVIGDRLANSYALSLPFAALPAAAFFGALITTWILQRIATRGKNTSVAIFLLGGLAIAALANAGIGLLVFVADDRQLRDVTFWLLGSLGGTTWDKVMVIAPFLAALLIAIPFYRARPRSACAGRSRGIPHGDRSRAS